MYSDEAIRQIKTHIIRKIFVLCLVLIIGISTVIFFMVKRNLFLSNFAFIVSAIICIFIVNYYVVPMLKYLKFIILFKSKKYSELIGVVTQIDSKISKIDHVDFNAISVEALEEKSIKNSERLIYLDSNYENNDIKIGSHVYFKLNDRRIIDYRILEE